MSATVILDADFLSAFLKIERLPLLLAFYQVERLYVPPAVYRELAVTTLLPLLLASSAISVESPTPERLQSVASDDAFGKLGAGEQEAIALARIMRIPFCYLTIGRSDAWRPAAG